MIFTAYTKNCERLSGKRALRPTMYIGKSCKNGHGENGKTVRYKNDHGCVLCRNNNSKKSHLRDTENRPLDALRAYEEKQGQEEYDPLF